MTSERGRALPWWAVAPAAGIGGLCATAAFQPYNAWPLAFVAAGLLGWAVSRTPGVRASMLVGWVFGLLFMATSLIWQTSIMIASYAGLTLVMSLFFVGLGAALHAVRGLPAAPLWGAGAWTAMEWLTSEIPFDGFAWMRLGYTQLDSWLAGFYPLTGAASVTFLVAGTGLLGADLLARPGMARAARLGGVLVLTGGVGLAGIAWLPPASATPASVAVGWVQPGAPGGGVYGLGPARTIAYNSRDETGRLMARVATGELPGPAFIAWPENSTDLDPRTDAATRNAVEQAVAEAGVPILVGAIYEDHAREERQTVALWWDDDGPELSYAKRDLVPFGEWIPFRGFFLPLIPQLEYVGYQSVPGTRPGSFAGELADGRPIEVGVAICYEVIYPETIYEAARDSRLMIVQSSNAMYQGTIQIDQQFAATRVRAAEMRREILVVTTSGLSGLVGQRGEVLAVAPDSVSVSGVHTLALRTTLTPAMVASRWVEYGLAVQGVAGVLVGLLAGGSRRRDGTMVGSPTSRGE